MVFLSTQLRHHLYRILLAGCCLSSVSAHAAYTLKIDAPEPLHALLGKYLDLSRYQTRADINDDQFNFMTATAAQQVKQLAATEGYFSARSSLRVERHDGKTTVFLSVTPGPRTLVESVHLDLTGAAAKKSPHLLTRLEKHWKLKSGKPFRQEDWSDAKEGDLPLLRNHRYAAAKITESEARIDPAQHRADLSVHYDSGPAFTLGPVVVKGAKRYPASIVRNVDPLVEGEPFDAQRLQDFQQQILKTPYYSNAIVDINRDPQQATRTPVEVEVTEFPAQKVSAGAGFSTDTGASITGQYANNNVFGRAWVFDSQAKIEQQRQLLSLGLAMPPDRSAFTNSAHILSQHTTLSGVDLHSEVIGLWRMQNGTRDDFGYKLQYYKDSLQQLDGATLPADTIVLPGTHQALVPSIEWTRRRLDNPTFPRDGYILSSTLGAALQGAMSDETFVRGTGEIKQFLPIGRRDLMLLRADLGAVVSKGGNASIPASLLFRAGGTESIRGYAYQSVGNLQNGTVYPARYMATGSVEYQHWVTHQWGGAVFYDAGTVTDNWPDRQFFQGVGVGLRWRSPVGPINADLAYGVKDKQFRPHLSLGFAF